MAHEAPRKSPGFTPRALAIVSDRFIYTRSIREEAAEFYKHSYLAENERASGDTSNKPGFEQPVTLLLSLFLRSNFPYLYLSWITPLCRVPPKFALS